MSSQMSADGRLDAIHSKANQLLALLGSMYGTGLDNFLEMTRDGQDWLLWLASDLASDIADLVGGHTRQTVDLTEKFPACSRPSTSGALNSKGDDMLRESVGLVDSASGIFALAMESHTDLGALFDAIAEKSEESSSARRLANMGSRLCEERENEFDLHREEYGNHATRYLQAMRPAQGELDA